MDATDRNNLTFKEPIQFENKGMFSNEINIQGYKVTAYGKKVGWLVNFVLANRIVALFFKDMENYARPVSYTTESGDRKNIYVKLNDLKNKGLTTDDAFKIFQLDRLARSIEQTPVSGAHLSPSKVTEDRLDYVIGKGIFKSSIHINASVNTDWFLTYRLGSTRKSDPFAGEEYASLKDNKPFMLVAAVKHGTAFEFANSNFKNSRDGLYAAMLCSPYAYKALVPKDNAQAKAAAKADSEPKVDIRKDANAALELCEILMAECGESRESAMNEVKNWVSDELKNNQEFLNALSKVKVDRNSQGERALKLIKDTINQSKECISIVFSGALEHLGEDQFQELKQLMRERFPTEAEEADRAELEKTIEVHLARRKPEQS